jgi:hypothetical protein
VPINNQYKSSTPVTAHDNTFTGSLNPNTYLSLNESSDSSAEKPDAFRWLHQKYGNQASIVPDKVTKHQSNPILLSSRLPISTLNLGNDDDDDIFDGLDEAITEDDQEQVTKDKSPDRIPSPTIKTKADDSDSPLDNRIHVSINEKIKVKKEKDSPSDIHKISPRPIEIIEDGWKGERNFHTESNRNVGTEIATEQKKRHHRPFPVETTMDDVRTSLSDGPKSLEREDAVDDYGSDQDENKPPVSVLKNLGSVIVKSIQRACAIPGKFVLVLYILTSVSSNILLTF